MRSRSITKILFLAILSVSLGMGLFFSCGAYRRYQQLKCGGILLEDRERAWISLKNNLENEVRNFKGTVGIVIKDFDTNWEITANKEVLIPSASLVKVPIMLSCFYAANEGKISLQDVVPLRVSDKVGGSKILGNEPAGSVFKVGELLEPMITQSDNAAANVLIDYLGFDSLNGYFRKMGLKKTNISRRMMDFKERRIGIENYTTAEDMAYLLEELYRKNFLSRATSEQCLKLLKQQKVNDRIPRKLPKDGVFIAHKTGLEKHVCHDVGIVFTKKGDFLICVLIEHRDRFAKSAKKLISDIASLTYNYYQRI